MRWQHFSKQHRPTGRCSRKPVLKRWPRKKFKARDLGIGQAMVLPLGAFWLAMGAEDPIVTSFTPNGGPLHPFFFSSGVPSLRSVSASAFSRIIPIVPD